VTTDGSPPPPASAATREAQDGQNP
jgi:hypothetical protein